MNEAESMPICSPVTTKAPTIRLCRLSDWMRNDGSSETKIAVVAQPTNDSVAARRNGRRIAGSIEGRPWCTAGARCGHDGTVATATATQASNTMCTT